MEAVWKVLTDPSYLPKLYPDIISVSVKPSGLMVPGQKRVSTAKAGRRIVEIHAEVVEVIPQKKLVVRNDPGGIFSTLDQVMTLEARGKNTALRAKFEFTPSKEYIGDTLNLTMLENVVKDNIQSYFRNLKEISELLPLR